jgi:hypothetical protein
MDAATQVICSCALTFGVPIIAAGWELWRLKPTRWRPPSTEDIPAAPGPLPDPYVAPRVQKPLPDCLIPRPAPAKVHEPA